MYGVAMSKVAVARFRAVSSANGRWDSARIRAYQRSLDQMVSAPEGIVRVPRAGIEVPLLEGTSDLAMNRGVGHVVGTALPGERGNLAIAGHRDGFFRGLKDVSVGDVVEVERPRHAEEAGATSRQTDRYVIRAIKIVSPSDVSVLRQTPEPTLTLITCYPFYFVGAAPQRYVVQASLVSPPPSDPAVPHLSSVPSTVLPASLPQGD